MLFSLKSMERIVIAMIEIVFTEEEIQALNYQRYHYPHPRVQRKMEALWLKSQKVPHKQIAKLTSVSVNVVTSYLREYKAGGIERLKELKFYQPKSELAQHTKTIEAYFHQHPPATIKEAMSKIEELTGIKRSETQVRKFLKSIGLYRRKVGMIPSKADPDKQESFKKNNWSPACMKLNREKGSSFLWMLPILC
jgi:transposase